jgi:hypothetical protein
MMILADHLLFSSINSLQIIIKFITDYHHNVLVIFIYLVGNKFFIQ